MFYNKIKKVKPTDLFFSKIKKTNFQMSNNENFLKLKKKLQNSYSEQTNVLSSFYLNTIKNENFLEIFGTEPENHKNDNKFSNLSYQITCKQCLILNNRTFYGSFYLGPFESGQSITIANALRRTLLSELPGVAIIAAEIEGVTHEYSSLPGVKETVLDILLNLKEIVLKPNISLLHTNTSLSQLESFNHLAFLQINGPGIVRACDIKLPPYLLHVDPDQYIATLAEDGLLNIKLYIAFGKNFKSSSQIIDDQKDKKNINIRNLKSKIFVKKNQFEQNLIKEENKEKKNFKNHTIINMKSENITSLKQNKIKTPFILYLDPVFMPVTKVNYIIEENPLDFSSQIILLEIWTNGSIHPRKALQDTLKKLVNIFFCFWELKTIKNLFKITN
jgi:DNA-directed RNA polymerase alpha subunit